MTNEYDAHLIGTSEKDYEIVRIIQNQNSEYLKKG